MNEVPSVTRMFLGNCGPLGVRALALFVATTVLSFRFVSFRQYGQPDVSVRAGICPSTTIIWWCERSGVLCSLGEGDWKIAQKQDGASDDDSILITH
jgi:hypothetical protein